MRNSALQHLAAATLAFAQTKRKACDFPRCAHIMVNHKCFLVSKYEDKHLWKKLLPSMRIYMAGSEEEKAQQWNWHDKAPWALLLGWFIWGLLILLAECVKARSKGSMVGFQGCVPFEMLSQHHEHDHFSSCHW